MSELTVVHVEPARMVTDGVRWESPQRDRGHQPRRRRAEHALSPLIASALPEADPDACEMYYQADELGNMIGVVVREAVSQRVIATFSLEQLAHLVETTGQRGVLFESRG